MSVQKGGIQLTRRQLLETVGYGGGLSLFQSEDTHLDGHSSQAYSSIDRDEVWRMFQNDAANSGYAPQNIGPDKVVNSRSVLDNSYNTSPVLDGKTLYVGDDTGIRAIDLVKGKVKWTFPTDDPVKTTPVVLGGMLNFAVNNTVFGLQTSDGSQSWKSTVNISGSFTTPTATADVICFGSDNGVVALSRSDGTTKWLNDFKSTAARPAIGREILYAADFNTVEGFSVGEGRNIWTHDILDVTINSLTASGKRVIVGIESGTIYDVDFANKERRWQKNLENPLAAEPAITSGTIYVGDENGTIHAIEERTGQARWRIEIDASITTPLVVADGVVYVSADDGYLYAIKTDGDRLWKRQIENLSRAPAVANSMIYVNRYELRGYRVEASENIQQLRTELSDIRSRGFNVSKAEKKLDRARIQFNQGEYKLAYELSKEGLKKLEAIQQQVQQAETAIQTLQSKLETARKKGYELPKAADNLSQARKALNQEKDYKKALKKANNGLSIVNTTLEAHQLIQNISKEIEEARKSDIPVSAIQNKVSSAQTALEKGEYKAARSLVEQARTLLNTAKNASQKIQKLQTRLSNNEDLNATSVSDLLSQAENLMRQGGYQEALETATTGLETLKTAKNASTVITDLEKTLSTARRNDVNTSGATESLEQAKTAYREGEYQKALTTAKKALNAFEEQLRARSNQLIKQLESKIQKAKNNNVNVDKAEKLLQSAKTAHEKGEYLKAISNARQGKKTINRLQSQAKEARTKINKLRTTIQNGSPVPKAQEKLSKAESAFNKGNYAKAKRLAKEGLKEAREGQQIDVTLQHAANAEGPEIVVRPVADLLGRDELVRKAFSAYEKGNYQRAGQLAQQAEKREDAAFISTGALAASVGYLSYRKLSSDRSLLSSFRNRGSAGYDFQESAEFSNQTDRSSSAENQSESRSEDDQSRSENRE